MSRDFRPCDLYFYDAQTGGKMRGGITLTVATGENAGEKIEVGNRLATDRYPELSFLYSPFDSLYESYKDNDKALKLLDDVEASLKSIAEECVGKSEPVPFKGKHDDTVEKWFYGKLDTSFYYNEENNELFGQYLEMQIAAYAKAYELCDTDADIHIDADIPRTDERLYTYRIGKMKGDELFADIYAGRNEAGEFVVHNYYDDGCYTDIAEGEQEFYLLAPEIQTALEEDACVRLKDELGLYEKEKFGMNHEGHGTIVVLAGASGSGKDTIRNALVEQGYERLVTSTTRSPRTGEQDGVDYYFKSMEDFEKGIADGSIFEYRKYESSEGVKYYGSQKQELDPDKDYVIVLDDTGIEDYQKAYGKDKVFAVLAEVPDEIRYQRAYDRQFPEGNPYPEDEGVFDAEWCKRLADDKARFSEEFIGRAINFRLDNEYALDDVVKALRNAQNAYEQAVKPDKHYVVSETMKNGQLAYNAKPADRQKEIQKGK